MEAETASVRVKPDLDPLSKLSDELKFKRAGVDMSPLSNVPINLSVYGYLGVHMNDKRPLDGVSSA